MRVRELRVEYRPREDLPAFDASCSLNSPRETATFLIPILEREAVEVFLVLCLTTKHQLIAYHEMGRGGVDTVLASPREVFKTALLANASSFVVAHNHPSGDPTPSPNDNALTRTLAAGAILLDLGFVDHVIVGDGRYFSFKEAGAL